MTKYIFSEKTFQEIPSRCPLCPSSLYIMVSPLTLIDTPCPTPHTLSLILPFPCIPPSTHPPTPYTAIPSPPPSPPKHTYTQPSSHLYSIVKSYK